jgi:hypothetical protein
MFAYAAAFNQDLSPWNTDGFTDISGMFFLASSFSHILCWNLADELFRENAFTRTDGGRLGVGNANGVCVPSAAPTSASAEPSSVSASPSSQSGSPSAAPSATREEITDANLYQACQEWLSDANTATIRYGEIKYWDTSAVTDMNYIFYNSYFDGIGRNAIGKWDTSNVISMAGMFNRAYRFNGHIEEWDTSKVTNMNSVSYERAHDLLFGLGALSLVVVR